MGAQNIANGSAALEPDFSANTINTTWYSNGEQLTGNNIPGTCRYDAALTPPTPEARPGYAFGGWKVKRCEIPSALANIGGNAYAAKRLDGGNDNSSGGATAETYGLEQPGEWGVSLENGDKVTGVTLCSSTGFAGMSELIIGTPNEGSTGQYCWCKATHYTASGVQQCRIFSQNWVYFQDRSTPAGCLSSCAAWCAYYLLRDPAVRRAVFLGIPQTT